MAGNYVEQIEKIKNDTSLSAEAKKKELKRLRRMIRKNRTPEEKAEAKTTRKTRTPNEEGGISRSHNRPKSVVVSDEPAIPLSEMMEKIEAEVKARKMKKFDHSKSAGLAFPLVLCLKQNVTDPLQFFAKYKARWGREATEYSFIILPKETLFLLGPVAAAGNTL